MINILWALLNLGIFILFLIICLKATKLIRERIGLFASLIFVFGLFSFMTSSPQNDGNQNPKIKNWTFKDQDEIKPNTVRTSILNLDKNLISSITLMVQYAENKDSNDDVAINGNSIFLGWSVGYAWKANNIIVFNTATADKLAYQVDGIITWRLLGTIIYTQYKSYKGTFDTKK